MWDGLEQGHVNACRLIVVLLWRKSETVLHVCGAPMKYYAIPVFSYKRYRSATVVNVKETYTEEDPCTASNRGAARFRIP